MINNNNLKDTLTDADNEELKTKEVRDIGARLILFVTLLLL